MWIIGRYRPNGSLKFADHPLQHQTKAAAIEEASRLAASNPGVSFDVFECVSGHVAAQFEPVAEKDRHGSKIVSRFPSGLVIVDCNGDTDDSERFQIRNADSTLWYGDENDGWCDVEGASVDTGIHSFAWCNDRISKAAATLPPPAQTALESDKRPIDLQWVETVEERFNELQNIVNGAHIRIRDLEAAIPSAKVGPGVNAAKVESVDDWGNNDTQLPVSPLHELRLRIESLEAELKRK